jgi:hypothetical protein
MSCELTIDDSTGVVVVIVTGNPTPDDLRETMTRIWQTREYLENLRVLWDLRSGTIGHLRSSDLRRIAEHESEKRPDLPQSRVAYLVEQQVDFGMARMLNAFLEDEPLEDRIFRDSEAAWAWLIDRSPG